MMDIVILSATELQKAKKAAIGTKSVHGGRKVVKTAQGWVPVGEGKEKGAKKKGAPKKTSSEDPEIVDQNIRALRSRMAREIGNAKGATAVPEGKWKATTTINSDKNGLYRRRIPKNNILGQFTMHGHDFAIHPEYSKAGSPNGNWTVTELSSGYAVANKEPTPMNALDTAHSRLTKTGRENFKKMIDNARDKLGAVQAIQGIPTVDIGAGDSDIAAAAISARKSVGEYPTELLKTKYTRRWRGPDGKWRYDYGPQKRHPILNPTDMAALSAGEKVKRGAEVMSGRGLPESTYADVPTPPKVNTKDRKAMSRALNKVVPGDYFEGGVPIDEMQEALKSEGYVILQEDGTEWSGMFLGSDGEALLRIGKLSEGRSVNGIPTYKPVPNSGLRVAWHEMNKPGRYEVIKYIT